jgi:hypothetical protein
MIIGYFLYEQFVLQNFGAALIDLPVNITQMALGMVQAGPIMQAIQRVVPQMKSSPLATQKKQ